MNRSLQKERGGAEKSPKERDQLEIPTYHVYDRKTMPGGQGYLMYSNASSSISAVGNIFPVVLYLVAAMVTFTTMTRFVDEERTNAGIFKALGYRTKDIILKFVLYGFFAGTIGTLLGTLLGHYFLSGDHFQHYHARDGDWREQRVFLWRYDSDCARTVFRCECASRLTGFLARN